MSSDDLEPHRRRQEDLPFPSVELIVYQIGELKSLVNAGFERMDGRFDQAENRLTSLEKFRERQEERDRAAAAQSQFITSRWLPIFLLAVTIAVNVVLVLAGGDSPK